MKMILLTKYQKAFFGRYLHYFHEYFPRADIDDFKPRLAHRRLVVHKRVSGDITAGRQT
jgi:hypothetical protein